REQYVAPRTALETRLCMIWQSVLGLTRVGIEDNFFRIGGHSLLAIKLAAAIHREMEIEIPLHILFSYRSVSLLAEWLEDGQAKCELLHQLTPKSTATDKLFMVHAANCGSEVYTSLANELADVYNCMGINNYNLLTEYHISSLEKIAQIYLELILTETSIDKPVRILGWSLGGQLAMEIAFQLEQCGAKDIELFLLDTIINTDELKRIKNQMDMSYVVKSITKKLQQMGAEDTYVNKVLEAIPFENKIINCDLSGKLTYTKIILFKAGKTDQSYKGEIGVLVNQLVAKMPDNNISAWVTEPLMIKLIEHCSHSDIIEATSIIKDEIINKNSVKEGVSIFTE
ncbi:hypothetical protein ID850_06065, partial [Xenorhabdus sp. Flor]|uniref:thioesterase domain-containing protein n=1 Tax=Xenorhabdus cabanillasii TaxID=351673 RepID=UPI00199B6FD5